MTEHPAMAEVPEAMPITLRIREACRLSGIARYELIAAGEIEIIKVGTFASISRAMSILAKLARRKPKAVTV